MGHDERRSQRLVFQLGAALAVTALAPVSELFPANAAPIERLSAMREAARSGRRVLVCRGRGGNYSTAPLELAQTFDRAPVEKPADGTGRLRDDDRSRIG
jgi:hypothetical protein